MGGRAARGVLKAMNAAERLQADYDGLRLTTGPHPMKLVRDSLEGIWRACDLPQGRNGQHLAIAGVVICRQRPGTAKGHMFVSLEDAVVVIALPNLLANATLAVRERGHWKETRDLPTLLVAGVIGAALGTILFVSAPEKPLMAALILAIVFYVVTFLAHPDLRTTPERSRRLAPPVGAVGGVFQGAIGISGPIVGPWIHSYRLERGAHVLSVTTLFFASGLAQFTILVAHGDLSGRVTATLLACIPVLAAIPLGSRMRHHISGRSFDLAIIGILSISAVLLSIRTIF